MTRRRLRPAAALAGVLGAALALSACGTPAAGPQTAPPASPFDPFATIDPVPSPQSGQVAFPRWEPLATLSGDGSARREIDVADGAIQWRARWSCGRGRLRVEVVGAGDGGGPLVAANCPGEGQGHGIDTGRLGLVVEATGPWRLEVDQQVDTPLREPPLDAMAAPGARVAAAGGFYGIEREGEGTAKMYELPDGRLALRFERFSTLPTDGLVVWVSEAARPETSAEAFESGHVELGPLKSTAGEQNYLLPEDLGRDDVRSVVIWCVPVRIAYTAAALTPR